MLLGYFALAVGGLCIPLPAQRNPRQQDAETTYRQRKIAQKHKRAKNLTRAQHNQFSYHLLPAHEDRWLAFVFLVTVH